MPEMVDMARQMALDEKYGHVSARNRVVGVLYPPQTLKRPFFSSSLDEDPQFSSLAFYI